MSIIKRITKALKRPRLRRGGLAIILTASLAAALILVNLGVTTLEESYGWRRDYSFNACLTTGEETRIALDALAYDVNIYLLYASGEPDPTLHELLKRYQALSPRVSVIPTDLSKNPGILTRFEGSPTSPVEADSVIVYCEETGRYEILGADSFIQKGYNIELGTFEIAGLRYEKSITEAILFVTQSSVPVVGILQGHGELASGDIKNLTDFIKSSGYLWENLTLETGGSIEGYDLILILSPIRDITENELAQLNDYALGGGSFLFARDFSDPFTLPNLFTLMRGYGVVPRAGVVVASEKDAGSYDGELLYLRPSVASVDFTLPLIAQGLTALVMPGSSCFETPQGGDSQLAAASVLLSGENSYLRDPSDGESSILRQPADPSGPFTLGLYAQRLHASGNISRCFAIGCSATLTQDYMYEHTYVKLFILQLLGALVPQKSVSLDIAQSAAFHPGLMSGSQTAGLVVIILLPVLVLAACLIVLIPRRNR